MDKKTYDFTKKAARTAYEEAIRTGDGGTIEGHRHPDYALVDHAHEGSGGGPHTHTEYAETRHNHDGTYQPSGNYALEGHTHEGSGSGGMNVVSITQEEYDALETKSVETLYVVI